MYTFLKKFKKIDLLYYGILFLLAVLGYFLNNEYGYFLLFFASCFILLFLVQKNKNYIFLLSIEMFLFLQSLDMVNFAFQLGIPNIVFIILFIISIVLLIFFILIGLKTITVKKNKVKFFLVIVLAILSVLTYSLSFHASSGALVHWYILFIPITYLIYGFIYKLEDIKN